jgi:hypothetical protein
MLEIKKKHQDPEANLTRLAIASVIYSSGLVGFAQDWISDPLV